MARLRIKVFVYCCETKTMFCNRKQTLIEYKLNKKSMKNVCKSISIIAKSILRLVCIELKIMMFENFHCFCITFVEIERRLLSIDFWRLELIENLNCTLLTGR